MRTTDETVSANSDSHRSPGGNPSVSARQATRPDVRGWREDDPSQGDLIAEANLDPEAVDGGLIILDRTTVGWRENATEWLSRNDDKRGRAGTSAA